MLFLYRPRQTWMPYRLPRNLTEQGAYNRQLKGSSTRRGESRRAIGARSTRHPDTIAELKDLARAPRVGRARRRRVQRRPRRNCWQRPRLVMTTNAERTAILVRALHAAVHGDRTALTELYTDDIKAWTPLSRPHLWPSFSPRSNAATKRSPRSSSRVTPFDVSGDYACAEWRVSMTHTGDLELRDTRSCRRRVCASPSTASRSPSSKASASVRCASTGTSSRVRAAGPGGRRRRALTDRVRLLSASCPQCTVRARSRLHRRRRRQ